MKLDKSMKLADLMYGHGEKYMCFLHGLFSPDTYPDAPPIQICEMKCGCWVVADGNDRVGLILKNGRVLVVEYKDANGWTDAADDRLIGGLWAELSGGHCQFVMVKDKQFSNIEALL